MTFVSKILPRPFPVLLTASATAAAFVLAATVAAEESHQHQDAHAGHEHTDHAAPQRGGGGHEGQTAHDHSAHGGEHAEHGEQADGGDPHAHHRAMMEQKDFRRSEHTYRLGDVALTTMSGEPTTLAAELDDARPVMVNFIFTTCTTICPVMSGTFAKVQDELGTEAANMRMVSFSIDPEYDTPERLRVYAKQFGAGPQWQFLTGDLDNLVAVQKAFDVYRGNKMNHEPTTLMRRSPDEPWVRLDGLASAAEIVAEYRGLAGR